MSTAQLSAAPADSTRLFDDVARAVTERPADPGHLHDLVEGVHRMTGALAELIDTIMTITPAVLADDNQIREEVLRDLRAARGCLTTAGLLIAPAVEDLNALATCDGGEAGHGDLHRAESADARFSAITVIDGTATVAGVN